MLYFKKPSTGQVFCKSCMIKQCAKCLQEKNAYNCPDPNCAKDFQSAAPNEVTCESCGAKKEQSDMYNRPLFLSNNELKTIAQAIKICMDDKIDDALNNKELESIFNKVCYKANVKI